MDLVVSSNRPAPLFNNDRTRDISGSFSFTPCGGFMFRIMSAWPFTRRNLLRSMPSTPSDEPLRTVSGIIFIATAASILLVLASPSRQRCWTASAGLAALLAVFVATRSESVLVYVLFLLFVAAFCLREFVSEGWALRSLRGLVPAVLLPSLALIRAARGSSANKAAFGVFTFCSFTSTAFTPACNDLLAMKPAHDIPYVPVTQDSRSKAYAVSPPSRNCGLQTPGARWSGKFTVERYRVDPREIGEGIFSLYATPLWRAGRRRRGR